MKVAIFKVNQLGDNVVFLPIVQALRRLYPDWELALFTSPTAAPLYSGLIEPSRLRVERTEDFNGAWKNPSRLRSLWQWLRDFGPDASQLGDDQGNVAHLLGWLAGGKVRAGIKLFPLHLPSCLTHTVRLDRSVRIGELNWEIARTLVKACSGREWPKTLISPDLTHLGGGEVSKPERVIIHAGASREYKRWPLERFAELGKRLASKWEVIWIETPDSPAAAANGLKVEKPQTLKELVTLLASAGLYIGNNSGPMHLCSALAIPSVILNGPSGNAWDPLWHSERFLQLRDLTLPCQPCDNSVKPAMVCRNQLDPFTCLTRWTVDEVEKLCRSWQERWSNSSQS